MTSTQLFGARTTDTSPNSPATGRAARRKHHSSMARRRSLAARYLGYVGYFVGAGLISGAVVHHPLDPDRYTRIAAYGALVFLAATVLNEFVLTRERPGLPRLLLVMGASLLLSFGIGMLSGGLQHFDDFPARGAVLVPAGLVVSFVAYVIKDADTPARRIFGVVGLAVLVTATVAFLGLREVAASMESSSAGGGHSHGTAEEPEADDHAPAATTAPASPAAPAPGTSPTAKPAPATPSHADGHAH
ncbi:hypothetical protein OG898_26275 [Streptomyces sp. NBC_00193]|uniref:hypothetical protein n=1 Tax=unclassified Streptomyces TaxID=2593676 RepID=UPI00225AC158|nr:MULTISPECIES: hypothetical protein [unclassified Streptomyces]MCX5126325.1 hypothetical protein [Streptomyces sp. NBC_00347]MCX5299955.1 hypothetical protein [Streptomyces sp. NBC_00193]